MSFVLFVFGASEILMNRGYLNVRIKLAVNFKSDLTHFLIKKGILFP